MGPAKRYFSGPTKSVFVEPPADHAKSSDILQEFKFDYGDGHHYIGTTSFISTITAKVDWLQRQINKWVKSICLFSGAAWDYLQAAFAGLTKSLQLEWAYLQCVVLEVAEAFFTPPVEYALAEEFLHNLFGDNADTTADIQDFLAFPVKFSGLSQCPSTF